MTVIFPCLQLKAGVGAVGYSNFHVLVSKFNDMYQDFVALDFLNSFQVTCFASFDIIFY